MVVQKTVNGAYLRKFGAICASAEQIEVRTMALRNSLGLGIVASETERVFGIVGEEDRLDSAGTLDLRH